MNRPHTKATLNKPIANNAFDTSCTKTTSTPRAGGLAKPGHAASEFYFGKEFLICTVFRLNSK